LNNNFLLLHAKLQELAEKLKQSMDAVKVSQELARAYINNIPSEFCEANEQSCAILESLSKIQITLEQMNTSNHQDNLTNQ
jgi:hypothetical protein